jgi:hypothetical protein
LVKDMRMCGVASSVISSCNRCARTLRSSRCSGPAIVETLSGG